MVDYGLICTLQLYYGADKQTAAQTRTGFGTRDETSFPLKTPSYSQDAKLWHCRKSVFKLQPHLLTGALRVCLMNIGTCAQWDAKINRAQLPPLIKATRDKPITEGCCHYLYSCTHGANMDSTGTELAKLRAPLVPRVSPNLGEPIFYLHNCTNGRQIKLENDSKPSVAVLIKYITAINVIIKY